MPNLPDVVLWSIPAFVLLTVLEATSYRFHPDEDEQGYRPKDTATSRDRIRHLVKGPGWQPGRAVGPTLSTLSTVISPEGTTAC